jgi:dTDP-glucose 4,6-dehydratase
MRGQDRVRFAVIGSNSFSGSHFVRHLLTQSSKVLGVSRSTEIEEVFNPYKSLSTTNNWTFNQIDARNADALRLALLEFSPDFVVNFAAQSMVGQSWVNPEDWYDTNVVGVAHLAKTLKVLPNLQRYVHVTTPEVYGSTDGWIKESFNFKPSTPYAVSRAAGDWHLKCMYEEFGLPVVFTRAANVYGPGQQLYRIVPRAILSALLGRKLPLDGGGLSTRAFIHINDVARATQMIAENGTNGETYHISTDHLVAIRGLVEQICELTGIPFESFVEVVGDRPGKDKAYQLDSSKIKLELGWAPEISLEKGLLDTLKWVQGNLEELSELPVTYSHKK